MIETCSVLDRVTAPNLRELAPQIANRMSRAKGLDTIVVLRMPHCEPLFANRPYGVLGHAMPVARTAEEVLAYLEGKSDKGIYCFCREMRTMLALRPDDCTHESDFEDFCADPLQRPLSGFEFFQMDDEPGTLRQYRVARVHSRLLKLQWQGRNAPQGLIEVRVVESAKLRMEVSGQGPAQMRVRVAAGDETILDNEVPPVAEDKLPAYRIMEDALLAVMDTPGSAAAEMEKALRGIRKVDPAMRMYPTCDDIRRDVEKTPGRAAAFYKMLYDGPVAGTYARRELARIFSNGAVPGIRNAGQEMETDLARMRLRLDTLEATDPILANPA